MKNSLTHSILLALVVIFGTSGVAPAPPATKPSVPDVNTLILRIADSYPDGGAYRRDWGAGSGSPDEIRHAGVVILPADKGGTYCCGFTLSIVMRAMEELNLLEGKTAEEVKRFQKLWYGSTPEDRQRLVTYAVEDLGVGREVSRDDAKPGDFLQLWRTNKSGHSVVFTGWLTDEQGRRIGVKYRSSQGGTDGIGNAEELFAGHGGKVDIQKLHFARLNAPKSE